MMFTAFISPEQLTALPLCCHQTPSLHPLKPLSTFQASTRISFQERHFIAPLLKRTLTMNTDQSKLWQGYRVLTYLKSAIH